MPASSLPGEKGSGGLNWYLFSMIRTSGKLTLAALTEITASPGPGDRRRDLLEDERLGRTVGLTEDSFHKIG